MGVQDSVRYGGRWTVDVGALWTNSLVSCIDLMQRISGGEDSGACSMAAVRAEEGDETVNFIRR